jgi:hypothetical protein
VAAAVAPIQTIEQDILAHQVVEQVIWDQLVVQRKVINH